MKIRPAAWLLIIVLAALTLRLWQLGANSGATGAVGVENADGSVFMQYSCDTAALGSGVALLFCPACVG